ncbi:hypothetical protein M9H77_04743 [Catharanthus roseus]|uniref:Uncharacterized protein n=1 Tax=Catharanthus roseus TaxID=4058 RepID=A0ACC0CF38_CATRO|nr:hypothetical protein M9H77_04743 [Catharanthus roseus]
MIITLLFPTDGADNNVSFSFNLIHRYNSPQTPMNDPQIGSTSFIYGGGVYLMEISFGTPPVQFLAVVDTGSEISWIQCMPCIHCFRSESNPFDPNHSRTFQLMNLPYSLEYEDDSYTRGELARDVITIGNDVHELRFPHFLFGCGHENDGVFPVKSAGLLGFGPQLDSFISQLEIHKFSHCMNPFRSRAGRISFGTEAVVSGPGVFSTPLIIDGNYYVKLHGVSVGTRNYINNNDIKIVIDSGTTFTYLPPQLQSHLEALLRNQIRERPVPNQGQYKLCYSDSLRIPDIPKLKFHFAGAAEVQLYPSTIFVRAPNSSLCLSILPTRGPVAGRSGRTHDRTITTLSRELRGITGIGGIDPQLGLSFIDELLLGFSTVSPYIIQYLVYYGSSGHMPSYIPESGEHGRDENGKETVQGEKDVDLEGGGRLPRLVKESPPSSGQRAEPDVAKVSSAGRKKAKKTDDDFWIQRGPTPGDLKDQNIMPLYDGHSVVAIWCGERVATSGLLHLKSYMFQYWHNVLLSTFAESVEFQRHLFQLLVMIRNFLWVLEHPVHRQERLESSSLQCMVFSEEPLEVQQDDLECCSFGVALQESRSGVTR